MKEDDSWKSSLGSDDGSYVAGSFHGSDMSSEDATEAKEASTTSSGDTLHENLNELRKELQEKGNLIDSLQSQLSELKTSKESALTVLQAVLRTETFLDKLDTCTGSDIMDVVGSLVTGAETLNIVELKDKALKFSREVMELEPRLVVAVLAAYDANKEALKDTDLEEEALGKIRVKPDVLLEREPCCLLSASRIEGIVRDDKMEATEYVMFCILETWSKSSSSDEPNWRQPQHWRKRHGAASDLIKHISLELIEPTLLYSNIRDSGLVNDTQLVEAFGRQALAKDTVSFFTKRSGPPSWKWEKSNAEYFERLPGNTGWGSDSIQGCIMKSGVHKFSFRVVNGVGAYFRFGIKLESHQLPFTTNYIGGDDQSWAYCCTGSMVTKNVIAQTIPELKSIKEGTVIRFILTLKGGQQNLLEMSLDGGKPWKFSALHDRVGCGFVPAASISGGNGKIEFLGFE